MATKTFTREELYELVWSRPRTALAKELGLSDVAIGKHCVRARVPMPAVGYWAKLAAGGKTIRMPLPLRLPGQSDSVVFGDEYYQHRLMPEDLTKPPVPHSFAEDIEEQVAVAVKLIGKVVATRDLSAPDRALRRVLESEAKRRAKYEERDRWDWYKPHFDEPVFQRHLRIFNSLARAFGPVYGTQEVRQEDEWIQGVGTLHHLVLHLHFGGTSFKLRVHEPAEGRRDKKSPPVTVSTLRLDARDADRPLLEWPDQAGEKIESQLTEVVKGLLRRAEDSLRDHAVRVYGERCKRYEAELVAIERRKIEDERKRLEAIEARKVKVRDEVFALSQRLRTAEDIRALVARLRDHPELSSTQGQRQFDAWAANALAVADGIDPMQCSLEQILGTLGSSGNER
jgi:hypothetical protein